MNNKMFNDILATMQCYNNTQDEVPIEQTADISSISESPNLNSPTALNNNLSRPSTSTLYSPPSRNPSYEYLLNFYNNWHYHIEKCSCCKNGEIVEEQYTFERIYGNGYRSTFNLLGKNTFIISANSATALLVFFSRLLKATPSVSVKKDKKRWGRVCYKRSS